MDNMPNIIDPYLNSETSVSSDRDSWKDMAQNIYTDVTRLFEKEGELIRTEMNEKVTQVKVATGAMVTSGVVLFTGVISFAAWATIVLNMFMALWVASTIVTVALLAIGGIMFAAAKKKLNANDLKPHRSIQAFGEIRHSLQEKVHEITKH